MVFVKRNAFCYFKLFNDVYMYEMYERKKVIELTIFAVIFLLIGMLVIYGPYIVINLRYGII